jgi:hypothetical protein
MASIAICGIAKSPGCSGAAAWSDFDRLLHDLATFIETTFWAYMMGQFGCSTVGAYGTVYRYQKIVGAPHITT